MLKYVFFSLSLFAITLALQTSAQAQVRVNFESFEVAQNDKDIELQYVISNAAWTKLRHAKAAPVITVTIRPLKGKGVSRAEIPLSSRLGKLLVPTPFKDFRFVLRVRDKLPQTKRVQGMSFGFLKPSFLGYRSDEIPQGGTSGFKKTDAVSKK